MITSSTEKRTSNGSIDDIPMLDVDEIEEVQDFTDRLNTVKHANIYSYFQNIEETQGSWVTVKGRKKIMFATYNYLGLLGHPEIIEASIQATKKYGSGTHGVRINGGTLDIHSKLESDLADFTDRDSTIVYSSGYATNVGFISTFMNHNDYIVSDKFNHASIVDGCYLSGAKQKRFKHNDMEHLETILKKIPRGSKTLVIADAVFSMDGDIFNLPKAREICNRYNALLMIDEAHSLGVLGDTGRGIEEYFNMPKSIDIKMGTLSKAIPSVGGYISGSKNLIEFLKHQSRPFIFSAALPPSSTAAAIKSLEILKTEGKGRCKRLMMLVDRFITSLKQAGFDTGLAESTPIVPVITGSEKSALLLTRFCQDYSLFVLPVLAPAVHPNASRLRINVTAEHTIEELDYSLNIIIEGGKRFGIIK